MIKAETSRMFFEMRGIEIKCPDNKVTIMLSGHGIGKEMEFLEKEKFN